jgi:hypothetical protein
MSQSSKELREKGNSIYSTINENFSSSIKELRLNNALAFYQQAINSAMNNDDLSSAYKNHSIASYDLFL